MQPNPDPVHRAPDPGAGAVVCAGAGVLIGGAIGGVLGALVGAIIGAILGAIGFSRSR